MKRRLRRVDVEAAAKVNLGWHVGAKRDDGFHDVNGMIQTISVIDALEITTGDEPGELTLSVPGRPELETNDNLIVAAAEVVRERVGETPATTIVLHKTIPVGAGLGGGSADAAAALLGLSMVWGYRAKVTDLVKLGAEIGSDVPPLLVGGLVHVGGRGEQVRRAKEITEGWVVLGVSSEQISAAHAYARFDEIGAATSESWFSNDLEPAACDLLPGLEDKVAAMREAAGVAFVSGSGPTVVGVADTENAARDAAAKVADAFDDVLVAQPTGWGVRLSLGS